MHTSQKIANLFHPLVQQWFESRIGFPTPIQVEAWPLIAASHHLLVSAPTGSGKTLAAFLWALNGLIRDDRERERTRVLYVSPLKALNNDVQRNLIRPLLQIETLFETQGRPLTPIRVRTRSGDTPSHERRQMIRRPPEILITTPESLHLLLSSSGGRSILGDVRTVILDEIHAVVGNKRGTLLMTAVERLVDLSGEFQRIALSATVKPEKMVADFVAGYQATDDGIGRVKRKIKCCRDVHQRREKIQVRIPEILLSGHTDHSIWDDLARSLKATIAGSRSTIIFTNSRRLCEKLAFLVNSHFPQPVAYAHHGSLSRELRLDVEQRMKNGDLKAVVATASLELGIDIGSLDHVILVQSPASISSAVQRIGRSGHGVGETSRATFYAIHATDLLTAAVLADSVQKKEIEPVRPVQGPLDVLAQVIVSMAGVETWDTDRLYRTIRRGYPFRDLQRQAFNLVIEMLAGKYAGTRIPSLKPKIALDRLDNTVTARKGALQTLYSSGGVIPDRGYFGLRNQKSGGLIGELDEEFVWEAKKGQVFTLGNQSWRIHRITHNDVFVRPARPKAPAPPFWRAEDADRDYYLSDRIARFLETADLQLAQPEFEADLVARYRLTPSAAGFLVSFLKRQRKKTGCALPHRHHLVVERVPTGKGGAPVRQVVIHTFWGGCVNRPFAVALEAALEAHFGSAPPVFADNDAIHLLLEDEMRPDDILALVTVENVEALIRSRLEATGIFGGRFRECASRALLIPRGHFRQRMPLWLSRQKSQHLFEAVKAHRDFPILLETWRTCLQDDFDMRALVQVLQELESGQIARTQVDTVSPSPMALSGAWRQINQYMYADDRQPGKVQTGLDRELIDQLTANSDQIPPVDAQTIAEFQEKRQRLHPGYAPDSPIEMLEWVKERLLIPEKEWNVLIQRAVADSGLSEDELIAPISAKLLWLVVDKSGDDKPFRAIVASEAAAGIGTTLYGQGVEIHWRTLQGKRVKPGLVERTLTAGGPGSAGEILGQWLRYYGPVGLDFIEGQLNTDPAQLSALIEERVQNRTLIRGYLIDGSQDAQLCDADNYDTLLRMARRRRRPALEARDIRTLPLVLAHYQGVTRQKGSKGALATCLQSLMGLPLPAGIWETEVFPSRLSSYDPHWLDALMQESALVWIGSQGHRIAFCHEDDLDLMLPTVTTDPGSEADDNNRDLKALFPDRRGRFPLSALLGESSVSPQVLLDRLWEGVWTGTVTNDSMTTLRSAVARKFKQIDPRKRGIPVGNGLRARSRRSRRRPFGRTQATSVGSWRLIEAPPPPEGLMEEAEIAKDRVRLLMDRYGILFRQLLERELPAFRWAAVFRSLRTMELSGEIVSGCFFDDLPGLQFVSQRMLLVLQGSLPEDHVYWLHAQDPASVCGLDIEALKSMAPKRLSGTHLVYMGSRLALVSERKGKSLQVLLPVDHHRIDDCLDLFDHLLNRRVDARSSITVETINGQPASDSRFIEVLRRRFDISVEAPKIIVYRLRVSK